jgi:hypothetical protein
MMPRQGQNIFALPPKGVLKLFQKLKNIKRNLHIREKDRRLEYFLKVTKKHIDPYDYAHIS